MNTPRFNFDRSLGAPSRVRTREYPKWIRVSHIGYPLLRDSSGLGRRKTFAIVTSSISADLGRKPVQRILIFDDHPDSLRLVSEQLNPELQDAGPRHMSPLHLVLGWVVILSLVLAMSWPLL